MAIHLHMLEACWIPQTSKNLNLSKLQIKLPKTSTALSLLNTKDSSLFKSLGQGMIQKSSCFIWIHISYGFLSLPRHSYHSLNSRNLQMCPWIFSNYGCSQSTTVAQQNHIKTNLSRFQWSPLWFYNIPEKVLPNFLGYYKLTVLSSCPNYGDPL